MTTCVSYTISIFLTPPQTGNSQRPHRTCSLATNVEKIDRRQGCTRDVNKDKPAVSRAKDIHTRGQENSVTEGL